MVIHVELEECLAPVVTAIGLLEVIVGQYANMLRADKVRVFVTIVDHFMASICHHLAELNYLLSICTGVKLLAGNCVR